MTRTQPLDLAGRLHPFSRVFPDRLEHPVARVGEAKEALLHERLQAVEVGVTNLLGGSQRAAASEDREAGEELLFCGREELVAPLDRGSQGLLTGIGVATALEQVEPLREALEDLRGRERLGAGGGELDGEGERVEAGAQLGDLVGGLELGARAEELDRVGLGERGHRVLDLAGDTQEFAGGDEQREVGAGGEERRKLGCRLDHLLQVVEQQEQLPLCNVGGEIVLGAERVGDRLTDEGGIAEGGQPDPEDACLVGTDETGSCLDRESRLARAARTCERDEAGALLDAGEHVGELSLPAQEGARGTWQVRVRDRLERRKGA